MKNVGILVILLEFLFHVNGQPWSTRFDYDYEPEPIPIRPSNQAVYRRPIQMRGVPRYRPPGISPLQQQQLSEIAEPIYPEVRSRPQPGLEIAASSFGGSYGSQPEPSRIQSESASNSVSDFMNRLVTTIPEIAEKMAKMAPTESKPKFNAGFYTFEPQTKNQEIKTSDFFGNVKKSGLGMFFVTDPAITDRESSNLDPDKKEPNSMANLVHSMPIPESLFSFNKLFSVFSGITPAPTPESSPNPRIHGNKQKIIKEDEVYDMRLVKGTPILKEEDGTSEIIQKPDEFVESSVTSTETPNPADNLLGTLLSGNLDKVDWFGALFNKNSISGAGEQNPISQILKGGFFGSGLDDDSRTKKIDDRNFN